jgi:hypothetical protein
MKLYGFSIDNQKLLFIDLIILKIYSIYLHKIILIISQHLIDRLSIFLMILSFGLYKYRELSRLVFFRITKNNSMNLSLYIGIWCSSFLENAKFCFMFYSIMHVKSVNNTFHLFFHPQTL